MKFGIGDKVRVRSWGSMKEEFGLDGDGDIPTSKYYFSSSMKNYCGKVLTVREVDDGYFMKNCDNFIFEDDMLELVKAEGKGLLEPLDSEEVKKRKEAEEPFRRVGLLPVHDDESLPETSEKYRVLYPSDLDEEAEEEEGSNDFITLDHLHKVVELENPNAEDADWQLTYEEIKTLYNRIIQVEKEAQ